MSLRVNPRDEQGRRIFVSIGQAILRTKSETGVLTLFRVLCGEEKLAAAALLMPEYEATLLEYSKTHKANAWEPAKHWSKWWTRPSHLCKSHNTVYEYATNITANVLL